MEDLLDWIMIADRANTHYVGPGVYAANQLDADGQKIWQIKNPAGHPWDIYVYDANHISHWVTENGDEGQFSNASAWKRDETPIPVMPRFYELNSPVTITTPGPNPIQRTTNCGADDEPLIELGPTTCITSGPGPDPVAWGGDIGTQQTIVLTYYYGHQREQFSYVKFKGLVQWQHANLTSGSPITGTYKVDQTTQHLTKVSGGCPIPVFPCYSTLASQGKWIGGAPGSTNLLAPPQTVTGPVPPPVTPPSGPIPPAPVVTATSPGPSLVLSAPAPSGGPINRLLQTPLLGRDGGIVRQWHQWFREQDTKVRPVITLQGKITQTTPIEGRIEGIGTTVQHVNPAGQLTSGGVGFNVDNVPDGTTYAKTAQEALTGGLVDLAKTGIIGSLASTKINANVTSNFTNNATVDSIDNGTNATIRAYGPGGVGTSWHQQVGANIGPEIPSFSGVGDYSTTYAVMYDPASATYDLLTDGFSTLPDGLLFAGLVTTVASGGTGGTGGGGGASGGGGGGGGHYKQNL